MNSIELYILDESMSVIGIIDTFKSLIWTKRFYECGDFELYIKSSTEILNLIERGYFIYRNDDDMMCLIEDYQVQTDVDEGDYLMVIGRCLKGLLDTRIVWSQTNLYGRVEECVRRLIDFNCINPTNTNRIIPNLVLGELQGFEERMEQQITGDNIYDTVLAICKNYKIGSKIIYDTDRNKFVFEMIKGVDRSYNQDINPYVVFSAEFDNLTKSNYSYVTQKYKNTALVAGEGEGIARKTVAVNNERAGLARRETYVDARDVSSNEGEITENDYAILLQGRGQQTLLESEPERSVEGEVETQGQYTYNVDYFLGDVVQVKNRYGIEAVATITESIESFDDTGHKIIPTFSAWELS